MRLCSTFLSLSQVSICCFFKGSDVIVNLHILGRIGREAPAEHIIASMTAVVGAFAYPSLIPFSHRFSRRTLFRSVLCLSLLSGAAMLVFMRREPFDEMHQKRLFIIHMENVRTSSSPLGSSVVDSQIRPQRARTTCSLEVRTLRLAMKVLLLLSLKDLLEKARLPSYPSLTRIMGTGMSCTPSPRHVFLPHPSRNSQRFTFFPRSTNSSWRHTRLLYLSSLSMRLLKRLPPRRASRSRL